MEQLVNARAGIPIKQKLSRGYFPGPFRNKDNALKAPEILLISDGELSSLMVQTLSEFFRIHLVSKGEEAWTRVSKTLPDMVLLEAGMPGVKAKEFCRLLKNSPVTAHIPLLFITGRYPFVDEISLFSLGAIDCLRWPFDMSVIRMKLYNILENNARVQKRAGILQLMGANNVALSNSDGDFLKDVVAVIDSHIDDPGLDVEQLSELLFMGANQVYRKIKRLTGYTAKKFISMHRLKTAANYLVYCRLNISEVAYMVGFSTPAYFSKCFKAQFGCTPREYTEKH